MKRTLTLVAVAVLTVTGCSGGSNDDTASDNPSPSAEASETTDPFAPNLDDRALRVGQSRVGQDVTTTLAEVKNPYPPAEYRVPQDGNQFVGLRLEQCVKRDVEGQPESTFNGDWAAITPSGDEYTGNGSSWNDWPSPKFPELVGMIPGRCVKGWLQLEVPKGTQIDRLIYRPGGTPVAEWVLANS
jgi:hypothetical protein